MKNARGKSWIDGYYNGVKWSRSRPMEDGGIAAAMTGPNRLVNATPHKIAAGMMTGETSLGVSEVFAHHYVFGYREVCPAYALGFFAGWMNVFAPRV